MIVPCMLILSHNMKWTTLTVEGILNLQSDYLLEELIALELIFTRNDQMKGNGPREEPSLKKF